MMVLVVIFGVLVSAFMILATLERLRPARVLPEVRGWTTIGTLFFICNLALSLVAPFLWDGWLGAHRIVDASGLGVVGGAIIGFLAVELGIYGWHRALHRVPWLWRFHRLHHSAERIDVYGGIYSHPLDVIGFGLVISVVQVGVIGVEPTAAAISGTFATFLNLFQHSNLATPSWLGWLIQRPENHALHHDRDRAPLNFGDIALWDLIFGTFENPTAWRGRAGLSEGGSADVLALLLGRRPRE